MGEVRLYVKGKGVVGMIDIRLPRLYNQFLTFQRILYPITLSLDLNLTPLSTASIQLPIGEDIPTRYYVELFSATGSLGYFRARSPEVAYGDGTSTTELEHAITEVGDWLIRGKVEGEYSVRAAMNAIWEQYHGTMWQKGSVAALSNTEKIDISYDHENVLTAMLDVLENAEDVVMQFDFSSTPWTLSFATIDSLGGTPAVGRLSRNVSEVKISYDDTDLCTQAYYQYDGNNWGTLSVATAFPDWTNNYGRIEKTVDTDSGDTQAVAKTKAKKFLRRNREPRVSIEITGDDLFAITGESVDRLYLGRVYDLEMADYGVSIKRNITALSWADLYNNPNEVTITLGDDDPELWGYFRGLSKKKK